MPVPQHLTNQPVSSMMKSPVRSIAMDDTVETIERTMSGNALSWVPVREPGGAFIGVVSASDLMHFHTLKKDAAKVPAWQICTYRPITVEASASIGEVAKSMLEHKIHHVVVVERGHAVGVVSALDFVQLVAATGPPQSPTRF